MLMVAIDLNRLSVSAAASEYPPPPQIPNKPIRVLSTPGCLLARHQGEILSKMMIAEQVWDMNFDSDANVVEVAIKRLRAKVDAPFDVKLLHTVRGMGYVLEVRPE